VEVWALGEDVLAWQGHPELSAQAMVSKITPYIRQLSAGAPAAKPDPVGLKPHVAWTPLNASISQPLPKSSFASTLPTP
jgi:hypothetical protein